MKTAASLIGYCYFWAVSKVWLLPLEQSLWGVKFLLLSVGWYLIKPFFWGWLPSCDQLPLQSLSAGSTK